MPANFTNLQAEIAAMLTAVTDTETVGDAAIAIINNTAAAIQAAVVAALTADDAADQGSIDAAVTAIGESRARLVAEKDKLGAAVTANTPAAPPTA